MKPLFDGIFLGGFECSCQRLEDGRRLDLHASTRHEELAEADYRRARALGMTACRDGVSWVATERRPGKYDFTRAGSIVRAAALSGVTVIWDLMHFGWPDDVDPFSTGFPGRFARYAWAFARYLSGVTDGPHFFAPINEISYLAWAGGDVRCLNPFEAARGVELKVQLVRATIEAIEAIREEIPGARFVQPEPIIEIHARRDQPKTWRRIESDNLLQYQTWDMLVGDVWPSLGGHPSYLDIVGVNFYPDNQFMLDGTTVWREDPRYKPLSHMLKRVWSRYQRPMIISETGSEGAHRADWIRYVGEELCEALEAGCELHGITIYPVVDYPGWGDERNCENGLWGYADREGRREIHAPMAQEMRLQTPRLVRARAAMLQARELLTFAA